MTIEYSVSRALALAIGWDKNRLKLITNLPVWAEPVVGIKLTTYDSSKLHKVVFNKEDGWYLVFDYRDPQVIFPIAERYGAFPDAILDPQTGKPINWEQYTYNVVTGKYDYHISSTAALCIALAVISLAKNQKELAAKKAATRKAKAKTKANTSLATKQYRDATYSIYHKYV